MKHLRILLALAAALFLGAGSAWLLVARIADAKTIHNGAWRIAPEAGSEHADMYTRAAVARSGLLALPRSDAIYLNAATDDSGARLDARCAYRVEGGALPAAWWSLTAYGGDGFLIANPSHRFSYQGRDVAGPDEHFAINVSAMPAPFPWLPLGSAKHFELTLRLYQPQIAEAGLAHFPAPHIVKGACS